MRLSGWHLPTEHVSASALAKGAQCPEQYRSRYLQKKYDKPTSDRLVGLVDHAVFGEAMKFKIAMDDDLTADQLVALYESAWGAEKVRAEKYGDKIEWRDDPEKLYETGKKMVLAYHSEVTIPDPVAVEERFEFRLKQIPVPIMGYIDTRRTDRILERKTAKQKVSKPKPGWRFQGRIYQLATGLPIDWHVVTKQVTPKVYTPDTEGCEKLRLPVMNPDAAVKMIEDTAIMLNECYARYGPDTPWPMTGVFHDWLCDYCPLGPRNEGSCLAWQD